MDLDTHTWKHENASIERGKKRRKRREDGLQVLGEFLPKILKISARKMEEKVGNVRVFGEGEGDTKMREERDVFGSWKKMTKGERER